MIGIRRFFVGTVVACLGAAPAAGAPGAIPADSVKTAFAVLVGFPATDQSTGGGALLVPGTVIPLTDEQAAAGDRTTRSLVEKSLSFDKAAEKLWSTFRLEPGRQQVQGKTEMAEVGKPVYLPVLADANVRIVATLVRFDNASSTFRVVFSQGNKTLADSTANVTRGGRAVVGGMDGPAAPYIFVFIEPEAAPESSGAKSSRLPAGITEPKAYSTVQPKYPAEAKTEKVQGVVVLDVVIDTNGVVLDATPLEDPDPRLTKSAIEAVRQWLFHPAFDSSGKPIKVHASITVRFKLK